MAAVLTLKTPPAHPALYSAAALPTPPATPVPATKSFPSAVIGKPVTSYPLLRSHHAHALRYVIAKLRWEQANNDYLRNEDAWLYHNRTIQKLEAELKAVESAQKGLDRFPNCFAALAHPKAHGPPTKEQYDDEERKKAEKEAELDAKIEKQAPWLKQLFIGPMTRHMARNMAQVRKQVKEGDFEGLSGLLPSANLRLAMGEKEQKPAAAAGPKKPYAQVRYEKESAKIKAELKAAKAKTPAGETTTPADKPKTIGPQTKEEWMASLPVFGPKTKEEYLLAVQREQRNAILTYLHKPWQKYDPEAADLMAHFGRIALRRLSRDTKAAAAAPEKVKARADEKKRTVVVEKKEKAPVDEKKALAAADAAHEVRA